MIKERINLKDDHRTVRERVGFYDFTHQLLEVKGKDARKFLDRIFVNSIAKSKPGMAKYTTMLNEDGVIIDDVIVFCMKEDEFWISTLFIDDMNNWLEKNKGDMDIKIKDITKDYSMWAVQGPDSLKVLNKILRDDISDMKFFEMRANRLGNIDVFISRSGFTGELGYEVYFNPKYNDLVDEALLKEGKKYGIKKIESDVTVTSLPIEKGYVMMDDLEGLNPLEAGFGWSINWNKDFVGKEALENINPDAKKNRLIGFKLPNSDDKVDVGAKVEINNEEVGKVRKSTYGYTVGETIGYALIDEDLAKVGDEVSIKTEGKELNGVLTERIFYDHDNEKRYG